MAIRHNLFALGPGNTKGGQSAAFELSMLQEFPGTRKLPLQLKCDLQHHLIFSDLAIRPDMAANILNLEP